MRILLLAHSFNSLTQRLWGELERWGHEVSLEFDIRDSVTEDAVARWAPQLIIAPFLKRAIPDSVWRHHRCIVLHPGVRGDRGPSALDWAITDGEVRWGVTALEANAEMDAGDVWASVEFPMRTASKASLYRNEVTAAAVEAVRRVLERVAAGVRPQPLAGPGNWRPSMRQHDRAIDWSRDRTECVLRKIRAADGMPGVADEILGLPVHLFDAHAEGGLRGTPGEIIAQRHGAICRATVDGAVWITHLKASEQDAFKLPAVLVLGERLVQVPADEIAPEAMPAAPTWRDIRYEQRNAVGVLHFDFYNGAMSSEQCERLAAAYRYARSRPTRVIVLAGGADFWSNGIHLNVIEASAQPADESWRNINAIDDVALEILTTDTQLTIAAMRGNAGAGGVFLALAADEVHAREGVVLNPHYKGMGNLYGSEYWTYTLPRRIGPDAAQSLTQQRLPLLAAAALEQGVVDHVYGNTPSELLTGAISRAQALAASPDFERRLVAKRARRAADESERPLAAYRADELNRMRLNFYGFDPSYHVARSNFVRKAAKSRTPLYLARHRQLRAAGRRAA
jgi:putative two-component system protein, hydrogenase maturation factor HypX/HoxX